MSDLTNWSTIRPILAIVLGAIGTFLLLPHNHGRLKPARVHLIGGILTAIGVAFLVSCYRVVPQPIIDRAFFYAFAIAAIAGGILMITSQNPVYSALWFAAVVLATCGLFLLSGAQFLAAGTIIVYAGAIIVTFLFVIMLAQATGQASYDRASKSPAFATLTSFLLLWSLLYGLLAARDPELGNAKGLKSLSEANRLVALQDIPKRVAGQPDSPVVRVLDRAVRRQTARIPALAGPDAPTPPHVAALGGTLFTDHLIAVEIAGAILSLPSSGRPPSPRRGRQFARSRFENPGRFHCGGRGDRGDRGEKALILFVCLRDLRVLRGETFPFRRPGR